MQIAALMLFLTLAAPAGPAGEGAAPAAAPAEAPAEKPAPAEKARVSVQTISAKPGDNNTGDGIDPRLAEKLRVSLQQLGVQKPDLANLGASAKTLAPGGAVTARTGPYGLEATCKSVLGGEVTLSVELFTESKDPKDGKKTVRKYSAPTTIRFSKPDQVQPYVQPLAGGKEYRLFVVAAGAEPAAPAKEAPKAKEPAAAK
jgi:hypothetical protein